MPESLEIKLEGIEEKVKKIIISKIGEGEMKTETIPVAFGLNSLNIIFVMNENDKLDPIEDLIKEVNGVNSVEVIDIRRAIG
jgi:translation elongation factor aEF-1 beta